MVTNGNIPTSVTTQHTFYKLKQEEYGTYQRGKINKIDLPLATIKLSNVDPRKKHGVVPALLPRKSIQSKILCVHHVYAHTSYLFSPISKE